jgi:signal transduction histidine kinase
VSRARLVDLVVFAGYFAVAAVLGRQALLLGGTYALVWPAAGIAVAWFSVNGWSRWLALDIVALGLLSAVINGATGSSWTLAVGISLATVAQTVIFGLLIRRWCPAWWGYGDEPPRGVERLRDLGYLAIAAIVASAASAVLGPVAFSQVSGTSWQQVVAWILRNATGIVAILPLAMLLRHRLRSSDPRRAPDAVGPMRGRGPIELSALVVVTVSAIWLVFFVNTSYPVPFIVVFVSVWAGARFSPGVANSHAIAVCAAVTVATVLDRGPLVMIGDVDSRALVLQTYLALVVGLTLALSGGRSELLLVSARLLGSERVATEQAALVRTILDTMADGVSVIDGTGRLILRNPAAQELLGDIRRGPDGSVESTACGLRHLDGRALQPDESPMALALAGRSVEKEVLVRTDEFMPGGRHIEVTARPLPDTDPPLVVIVFHDVTAERRERDDLASFAGVVAHDLLNPLTVVEGWSESLLESARAGIVVPPERQSDQLERILRAAQRMQHLISDLLAFTTARDQRINPVRVDLGAVAADVARGRTDVVRVQGGAPPHIEVEPDLPAVMAEPVLLRQVLDNLVGNAVKYVAPGVAPEVCIGARELPVEVDGDRPMVLVEVRDNGIGIPDGQQDRVFDSFHRAHVDGGYRGTGLGLSIVKRITERHGGTAWAATNPATGGTTMSVTFPAALG